MSLRPFLILCDAETARVRCGKIRASRELTHDYHAICAARFLLNLLDIDSFGFLSENRSPVGDTLFSLSRVG